MFVALSFPSRLSRDKLPRESRRVEFKGWTPVCTGVTVGLLLFLSCNFAVAQSTSNNFIQSFVYPNGLENTAIPGLGTNEQPNGAALISLVYFNGWAQELQSQTKSDRAGYVIFSRKYYDKKGRLIVAGKPLEISKSDSLNYNALADTSYHPSDSSFNRIVYLDETNDRVRFSMPYGVAFHQGNHYPSFNYFIDTSSLNASVTETIDEDADTARVYVDLFGRKIRQVTKMGAGNSDLITLFEYDGVGNLTRSISPKVYGQTDTAKYSTTYKYNPRNQLITKTSRDEGTVNYVYDNVGKLRFVQDSVHKAGFSFAGGTRFWTYYKYDAIGRVIEQGELNTNYLRDTLENKAKLCAVVTMRDTFHIRLCDTIIVKSSGEDGGSYGYNCSSYDSISIVSGAPGSLSLPATKIGCTSSVLFHARRDTVIVFHKCCYPLYNNSWTDTTITIHDSIVSNCWRVDTSGTTLSLYGPLSFPAAGDNPFKTVINQYDIYGTGWQISLTGSDTSGTSPKTRLTRTKIYDPNTATWSEEAYVYDAYGRVTKRWVYIPELAVVKKFQYFYDATGRILKSCYQQGQSDSLYQWFKYDNLSRLDSVFSSKANNRQTATREAVYDYDNNHGGKISQMKLGNNIQTVDYTYNVRDWLKYINDINSMGTDKFAMTLGYDTVGTNARYNGNIASSSSLIAGQSAYAYNYVYDRANRLVDANYTNNNLFSEKTISYDANGNIQSLTRHINSATGTVLTYTYGDATRPNKLTANSGLINTNYSYDGNGSTVKDGKNNFLYDYRNMPVKDTIVSTSTIRWFAYDQGGQRIKYLRITSGSIQDSSRIYVLAGGKITAEYIRLSGSWNNVDHYNIYGNDLIGKLQGTSRFYYLKDHLGSTRAVVKDSSGTAVMDSWTDYYPFGKESRSSASSNKPREQFTGKERDLESGLDYFGARYYNGEIARWIAVDPLSGKYPSITPYNYAANDPGNLYDSDGNDLKSARGKHVTVQDVVSSAEQTFTDVAASAQGKEMANSFMALGTGLVRTLGLLGEYLDPGGVMSAAFPPAIVIEGSAMVKTLLQVNKLIGAEGEKIVTEGLKTELGATGEVLEQVTGRFRDATVTRFDNVVVDAKTGSVAMTNETKTGNATLTNQQKRYQGGESVTLTGKNAGKAKGQKINVDQVQHRNSRVKGEKVTVEEN